MPGNHPDLDGVLSALREFAFRAVAYIPDMSAALKARFAGPEFELHDRPVALRRSCPRFEILIHHGGLSTAYAGLMSATPQLLHDMQPGASRDGPRRGPNSDRPSS